MNSKNQFMLFGAIAVAIFSTSSAIASVKPSYVDGVTGISVFNDPSTGMPRCLKNEKTDLNVLIVYKGDHLQRSIKAFKLLKWPGCESWPTVEKLPVKAGNVNKSLQVDLNANSSSVFGLTFPARVIEAMKQARMGATIFRNESNASEFIRARGITQYSQDLNVELTQKYGFGFSSEVYRRITEADPKNQRLIWEVQANYEKARSGKLANLRKRAEKLTLVFVPGLGGSPEQPRDPKTGQIVARDQSDMMRIAEELQVEFGKKNGEQFVRILDISPNGSVAGNREMIRSQLDKLLSEGRKIVIIGVCKGMAESVAALSVLHDQLNSGKYGNGEIVGVMNLSGYLGGSRMSSFMANIGPYQFLKWLSAKMPGKKLGPIQNALLNILPETSQESIQAAMKEAFPRLPKSAVYMNLVGIMPGDGTGIVGSGKQLQDMVIRKGFEMSQVKYGANDGYIEYPGTVIPRSYGLDSDVLPIASDHYLITGKFFGLDLTQESIRKNFYRALFSTMFDRMKSKGIL